MENFVVQTGSYDTAKDEYIGEETITFLRADLEMILRPHYLRKTTFVG
jgi:hypothetical protein